jgi:hypothetical protein
VLRATLWFGRKRTLKKYRSRPSAVTGALLPFHGICPITTIMKVINDARVRSIGVRIHAKRPTLPIFAAVNCDSCVKVLEVGNQVRLRRWWCCCCSEGGCAEASEGRYGNTRLNNKRWMGNKPNLRPTPAFVKSTNLAAEGKNAAEGGCEAHS